MTVSVVRLRYRDTHPTASILDWRMQLNNYLQVNGGTTRLQYMDVASGPAHKPTWHCTAYSESSLLPLWRLLRRVLVDGVPYASGTSLEKGEAREIAAHGCYEILRSQ
jgi:hypothetical protein